MDILLARPLAVSGLRHGFVRVRRTVHVWRAGHTGAGGGFDVWHLRASRRLSPDRRPASVLDAALVGRPARRNSGRSS
jgi:hypothetical protein